jgi:pyruvate dehydrogenase E1 component alpha subunit
MAKSASTKTKESKPELVKSGKKSAAGLSVDTLKKMYEDMLMIRRFEEKAGQLYGMGLIGGFCHLYIGQEAVVTGIQHAIKPGDTVVTTYRDHGHMLATGMDPKGIMAELTGRIDGFSRGKGGSMHMFSVDKGFYGGHGIVGASVPIGAGLAFAHKYRGDGHLNCCYYGDGAANQGQVYETYNMAALWELPILFVIENNEYAMGTSIKRHHSSPALYTHGEPFGIPGRQVNGMDVTEVYEAAVEAVEHIRSGKGPMLFEVKTYRYRGHSMSDPAKYRSKEEVDSYKTGNDCINNLRTLLVETHKVSEDELKEIDKKVKEQVNEAAEFAKASPEPDPSELWTDVSLSS